MTTQTPIQEFAQKNSWAGESHSAEVWGYNDGWEKILTHDMPYDAVPHFVYESHLHNTMLVVTGMAVEMDVEGEANTVRVRIYVYIDKGSLDYKTGFEINGRLEEDGDGIGGTFTDFLDLALSKRDFIIEAKRLWDESGGE